MCAKGVHSEIASSLSKRKIKAARIPYRVPEVHELPDRLRPVLAAIYAAHNPEMLEGPGAEALLSTFSGQERDLLDRIAKKYDLTQQQQAQCDAFVVAHGL